MNNKTIVRSGLLWDGIKEITPRANIIAAMKRFEMKFNHKPTWCIVNIELDFPRMVNGIKIEKDQVIRPNQIFVGSTVL